MLDTPGYLWPTDDQPELRQLTGENTQTLPVRRSSVAQVYKAVAPEPHDGGGVSPQPPDGEVGATEPPDGRGVTLKSQDTYKHVLITRPPVVGIEHPCVDVLPDQLPSDGPQELPGQTRPSEGQPELRQLTHH